MEDAKSSNFTDSSAPSATLASVQSFPEPPFPAWVPAVTVAVAMLVFLAVSFYLRHRKVVKKRQILMDYFYVIFQYGGMRRKRMVTSLCNTNAITLRELGRSFMMSCDDSGTKDNSCPFYIEDSPFSRPRGTQRRPLVKKHSFFKNRGMTVTKRYRGPFIRLRGDSEDQSRKYASSFQDIVMKFRTKRHHSEREPSTTRQNLLSPQFEGCSMSTIHGDEVEYESCVEENETPVLYNRQRRNACILQCDKTLPTFADVVAEAGRQSLGHSLSDRFKTQHSSQHGKRNSEPCQNLPGQQFVSSQRQGKQPDVFHVHGGMLSPSNVCFGSHGYIANVGDHCDTFQSFRNSEPTILIHSASTETEGSQGWNDIRSKCTNGAVILKRVPKTDGAPGEFYYEETQPPPLDRVARASLSKVSYVPSGNMNEYYNCISPNKETHSTVDVPISKITKGKNRGPGSSRSKRGRLSLGNLAVSNFNRRIDIASDSLPDYDPEQSLEKRKSSDSTHRHGARTAWTRLKSVFSVSRASESVHEQVKAARSLSISDAHRIIRQQDGSRWQRFLSVFTGFRSLPETKPEDDIADVPVTSNSYPLGLNLLANSDDNLGLLDLESNNESSPSDSTQPKVPGCTKETPFCTTASFTDKENDANNKHNTDYRQYHKRPNTLHLQSRTHSFPEQAIYGRPYSQSFQTMSEVAKVSSSKQTTQSIDTVGLSRTYRKHNNNIFMPTLPNSKRNFRSYSFEAGYHASHGMYKFRQLPQFMDESRAATPARLEGNNNESEIVLSPRRVRSLSPLHETNLEDSNKDGTNRLKYNLESVPDISVYMTPLENGYSHAEDSKFDCKYNDKLLNSVDYLLQHGALFNNSLPPSGQSILNVTDFIQNESRDKLYPVMDTKSFEGINDMAHATPEQNVIATPNCDSPLELNKPAFCPVKLPQTCYLTPEHRNISCSTDSVYYDTVSALGTPSTCDLPDMPDFSGLTSPWKLQEMPCVHFSNLNVGLDTKMILPRCNTNFKSEVDSQAPSIAHTSTEYVSFPNISATVSFNEMSPNLSPERNEIKSSNSIPTTFQTGNEIHSTATISVETISKSLAGTNKLSSTNSVQTCNNNLSNCLSTMSTSTLCGSYFQSLSIPEMKLHNKEHQGTNSESPKSSAPSTPTRRHSTPCPSPERSPSRQSGQYTPDEIYMANVARLPRLSQRTSCYSAVPNCASQNAFRNYDNTNGSAKENISDQAIFDTASA